MSAIRGFTTLQLLELATIAEANRLRATNQVPASKTTNGPEDLARSRTVINQIEAFLSQGGQNIALPIQRGLRVIKKLSGPRESAAWFNDGRAQPTFRARTPEGVYIEQQRARLYDYLAGAGGQGGAIAYLARQENYGTNNVGGQRGVMSAASALDEIVTTSWREAPVAPRSGGASPRAGGLLGGGSPRGVIAKSPQQAFQERLRKLEAVWALTQRNQEPEEVERRGGGGGGRIGQKQPASQEDVNARAAASNGFLAKNLAEVLAGNIQNRRRTQGVSAQVLAQNQALSASLRRALNLPAGELSAAQVAQARQALSMMSAAQLHQQVIAMGNTEALREALWASLGDVSLRRLVGGLGIRKPESANGRRDFRHSAGQARGAAGDFDLAFSRYVFDQLFDAYVQRGAGGDRLPEDAQKRSNNRGGGGGPRGTLGTNDKALQGLTLANAGQVASFVFKALQRQYTLEALKQGARAIGAQVDESAVLQDSVIQQIADHVVRSYNQQVQAGSPAHTSAVAAAVRLRGFSDLRTPAAVAEARQAIIRTLDAQNGFMTEPCLFDEKGQVTNYSKRDLKRIAKANGISLGSSSSAAACAQISGQVAQMAPSADAMSSGRRQERVIGVPAGPGSNRRSGARSNRRQNAAMMPMQGMGAMAVGPLSPNTQAAFANFIPQQPVGMGLGGGLGGARLSGSRSGSNSPRAASPLLGVQPVVSAQQQANALMGLFGQQ